jgi:Polyketide cyclase / dehydrase and lipid transport
MTDECVSATTIVPASAEVVFSLLADPATHAAIDGTGRVRGPVGTGRLAAAGQVFRMAMHHEDHPDGDYETANRVRVLQPPTAISWETGYDAGDGELRFGGWVWRYDLTSVGESRTEVTLSYDWSAVPASVRQYLRFPPFQPHHLDESLARLAELVAT